MSRHENDIAAEFELDDYDAESCPEGHHPSIVDRYAPMWVLCELCAQIERLRSEKSPGPGHHVALRPVEEVEAFKRRLAEDTEGVAASQSQT